MFWFDRQNPLALFMDKRSEDLILCNGMEHNVRPDIIADFTKMPFADKSFYLVVFDPPHLTSLGTDTSWLAQKYGRLIGDWKDMLQEGFNECFRVLKPNGTLIFKWSSVEVPLSQILELSPFPPMFGHTTKQKTTHWVCFFKTDASHLRTLDSTTA
jgi:SAM-dependent methyltransferase